VTASKLRVFVVEDHPATTRGLKMFLELSGYAVETAADVRSALKVAAKIEFDVLLCDLNLPDGTGWDLMERLCKNRPVAGVAYSAFDEPEHLARSKAAGFAEHVVKGTTPETIVAAIKRVAKGQERVDAAVAVAPL
jgi:DNA-binding NarL/FixJ family response regulator